MASVVLRYGADDPSILTAVGERSANLIQLRPARPGFGLYGPYVELPAGRCVARIRFDGQGAGRVTMDVAAECGRTILASRDFDLASLRDQILELPTDLPRSLSQCEVRLVCGLETRADILDVEIEYGRQSENPYATQPNFAFWRRAVAGVPPFALDPMIAAPFVISPEDKVATAGSCFAQHIARNLAAKGLQYFVPERAPEGMSAAEASLRNFGTFSARYGNIYTARQLLQLFQRADGQFQPELSVWRGKGDELFDPFRPQIQPEGYSSERELLRDRETHLGIVRDMFRELDVFVFTLGLTEAWISRADGAVIPIAPGVAGGAWDPLEYEFKNFTVADVTKDVHEFMRAFRSVNKNAKVILTVSPVPLVATYENRHVLVSTVYSKSVLRVAADEISKSWPNVSYFPSYEIITVNGNYRGYFESDLRSVNESGVQHVMRIFFKHYSSAQPVQVPSRPESMQSELVALRRVVCDEEALDS